MDIKLARKEDLKEMPKGFQQFLGSKETVTGGEKTADSIKQHVLKDMLQISIALCQFNVRKS